MWRLDERIVQRLHARARAERWHLSTDAFASFLLTSALREFGEELPDPDRLEHHYSSLHLDDLALACACAEGIEQAWDDFIVRYRPILYRAADALDPSGGARELADSLYAELFGLRSRDGERQSHFRYFHGRSTLATWLRAVLAQRYVDRRRLDSRVEPLADEDAADGLASSRPASSTPPSPGFIEIISRVMAAVVAALPARDRLRLRCYYAQEMTLAQVGRMLAESEATASRSLARTRRAIREQVERALRHQGLSEREIADGFAAVSEDSGPLDLAQLLPPATNAVEALDPPAVEGQATHGRAAGPERILVEGRKQRRQDRSNPEGHKG